MRTFMRATALYTASVCIILASNALGAASSALGVPAPTMPKEVADKVKLEQAQLAVLSRVPLSCDHNPWPASAEPPSGKPDLSQCVLLHPMILLRWGIKGDVISFGVQSRLPKAAWVAIGLSELGSMKGADMFMMKRAAASSTGPPWKLEDSYTAGFEVPEADRHQDLRLLSAVSENVTDSLLFVRRLAPCDDQDLPIIPGTAGFLIWAFGDTSNGYHGQGQRGKTLITLANTPQPSSSSLLSPVAVAGMLPAADAAAGKPAATAAGKAQANKKPAAKDGQAAMKMPRILGAFQAAAAGVVDFLDGESDGDTILDHSRALLGEFGPDNVTAAGAAITFASADGNGMRVADMAEPAHHGAAADGSAALHSHSSSHSSNKPGSSHSKAGANNNKPAGKASSAGNSNGARKSSSSSQAAQGSKAGSGKPGTSKKKPQQAHKPQQHSQHQQHKTTQQSRMRQGPQKQPFGPQVPHQFSLQPAETGPQPYGPQRLLKLLEVPAADPPVKKASKQSSSNSSAKTTTTTSKASLPSSKSGSGSRTAAPVSVAAAEDGVKVLELRTPMKTMPTDETIYMIHYIPLPSDKKYHILKFEPIVNSPLLHHAVAYTCTPKQVEEVKQLPTPGPYNRNDHHMICETFFMVITPNMAPYKMPAEAGLPMGTPTSSYIALEMHYNNPLGVSDPDLPGSGFRIYYTEQLRRHDLGLFTLAQQFITIPAGRETVVGNTSVCGHACTGKFNQPVTLVDGFFHMHSLGKSVVTRRYRNGKELAPIGHLRTFDYAYQDYTPIPPEAQKLLPGDELALTCTYDSSSRSAVTKFGRGTQDEMCVHWITYYPAQEDMGVCLSVGSLPFGICAPAPPESLQVALRNLRALPPAPQGGFKSLPQVVSWIAAAATPGTAATNVSSGGTIEGVPNKGDEDEEQGEATAGTGDAAAGIKIIQDLSDSHARLATAQQGGSGGGADAAAPADGSKTKAPIAAAASGVGLLLKLLRNGTLFITMNPGKVIAPYKATCSAELP